MYSNIDHPVWQDINFTPNWLFEKIVDTVKDQQRPITSAPRIGIKVELPATGSDPTLLKFLVSKSDLLSVYLYPGGAAAHDASRAADVGLAVGSTPTQLQQRWTQHLSRDWSRLNPEQQAALLQAGQRLAVALNIVVYAAPQAAANEQPARESTPTPPLAPQHGDVDASAALPGAAEAAVAASSGGGVNVAGIVCTAGQQHDNASSRAGHSSMDVSD